MLILNKYNLSFQTPDLEIQRVKINIYKCVETFASIILKERCLDIQKLKDLNWQSENFQEQAFHCDYTMFIQKLEVEIGVSLTELRSATQEQQKDILQTFKQFFGELMAQFFTYLPLSDEVVNCLDFVIFPTRAYSKKSYFTSIKHSIFCLKMNSKKLYLSLMEFRWIGRKRWQKTQV